MLKWPKFKGRYKFVSVLVQRNILRGNALNLNLRGIFRVSKIKDEFASK